EVLELDSGKTSTCFTKYCCRGLYILTAGQHGRGFDTYLLSITREAPELVGSISSNSGKYAVVLLDEGFNMYNTEGELAAKYAPEEKGCRIKSCSISDIDGDSLGELLAVEGKGSEFYGNKLVVLGLDNGLKIEYERKFSELNPWKVQTCDVNGDSRMEIALGVYKKTAFHPVTAKRPFLYNWNQKDIVPMWRGSRLSRPFDDYIYLDIDADGRDELFAVERLSDGKALINEYRWEGFGFESVAESTQYEDISEILHQYGSKESLMIKAKKEKGYTWIELGEEKGQLVEKTETIRLVRIKK
ncbi:MAG TPA: hypothetical protein VN549_00510, partial [Negativicutes bacterium]|nr:hypothetical protein [Negativicutes bacterium]